MPGLLAEEVSIEPSEELRGDSHMKKAGMLVVSRRVVNFGFWSRLGSSGKKR